jgi:phosphoribosyl 1,2-cyclic phosphodiesterase
MTARFTVLASGSSGNAALLEVGGYGLLIDCGLHPRHISARLATIGAKWDTVDAVILTHTHGDHWKDSVLADLCRRRVPLYAHPDHITHLSTIATSFDPLYRASLVRTFGDGKPLTLVAGLSCLPLRVSHDSDPTFAFRFDHADADGPAWAVGYASDLGVWSEELVGAFTGVDVLAIEYNHDEQMERASSRPAYLVQRVLGDEGHLSNRQAADLTRTIAAASGPGHLTHLVQLHLSRDCNHPHLAESAGRNALAHVCPAASVITALQDVPARSVPLARRAGVTRRVPAVNSARTNLPQPRPFIRPCLPGFGRG